MCPVPTRAGRPCPNRLPVGESACWLHQPADERAATRSRKEERRVALEAWWDTTTPACHDWPVTEEDLLAAARAGAIEDHDERQRVGWGVISTWQRGLCAICGEISHDWARGITDWVLDHDHQTGLVRGMLCRGCNISEGCNDYGALRRYRERPPAAMLGVEARYQSPFTGWAAPEPEWLWSPDPDRSPSRRVARRWHTDRIDAQRDGDAKGDGGL